MCNEKNNECCLFNILKAISVIQNKGECACEEGCERPYLGPISNICYNTRPVSFYNCQTGELWEIQYNLNGTTGTSNVFRVENLDECCCTCRVLIEDACDPNNITYTKTNTFFTIDLNCVSALQCHNDTYIDL